MLTYPPAYDNNAYYYEAEDSDEKEPMVNLRVGRTVHRSYIGRRSGCPQSVIIIFTLLSGFLLLFYHLSSRTLITWKPDSNNNGNCVFGRTCKRKVPPPFAWDATATRNLTVYVRPKEITTLIQPEDFCKDPPFVIFVVPSSLNNTKERDAIRATWGQWTHSRDPYNIANYVPNKNVKRPIAKVASYPPKIAKIVFLLGIRRGENPVSHELLEESWTFGDIVVEDFVDSYTNLTLKSVFMLKWIHHNCPSVKFVMKVDDDIFVNVHSLEQSLLNTTVTKTPYLTGMLICGAKPIHDKFSKWYSPPYMFKEVKYPNYLSGTGYVMSGDLIEPLFKAALSTPYLHLEDVFLTGICARSIGVRPKDNSGFSYQHRAVSPCIYKDVIMGHEVVPSEMAHLWNMLNQPAAVAKCHPIKKSRLRSHNPSKCSWR